MLEGLRHGTVIGSNDEQHEIDAGDAAQHVADEFLVARRDKADGFGVVQRKVREAQIDGQVTLFFFRQAVGRRRSALYQKGLAVIDMAGGCNNHPGRSGRKLCGKALFVFVRGDRG